MYNSFHEVNPQNRRDDNDPLESNQLGVAHKEDGPCAICGATSGDKIGQ